MPFRSYRFSWCLSSSITPSAVARSQMSCPRSVRTTERRLRELVEKGDAKTAATMLPGAYQYLDKAAKNRVHLDLEPSDRTRDEEVAAAPEVAPDLLAAVELVLGPSDGEGRR